MVDRELSVKKLSDGITLGILGGGQLGRMSAMAAARLGIDVIIFCPEKNGPASFVCKETIIANYDDLSALERFTSQCDFISYEFENIPIKTIDYINSLKAGIVTPSRALLEVSQDRIKEKSFLNSLGIETTRWAEVITQDDVLKALKAWNAEQAILKTARFGYDGKGQIKIDLHDLSLATDFIKEHKSNTFILEEMVDFSHEISIIIARDFSGKTVTYDPMLNEHKNHILHKTFVNQGVSKVAGTRVQDIAKLVANAVNLVGVLTIELFIGKNGKILVNEIAPRTHNSGHWSIDACIVSQFENHVRCVCGLPAGSTTRHSDAEMLNLIGDDINTIDPYFTQNDTYVHLYGKHEARAGRKMGHITFLKPKS